MAIVTTDMADNGVFQGNVMNSAQGEQSVINTFTSTLDVVLTSNGSADEKGLEVTKAALTNQKLIRTQSSNGLMLLLSMRTKTTEAQISLVAASSTGFKA